MDFELAGVEGDTRIRELNWPMAIDRREGDYTLSSNDNGEMMPRDWQLPYYPIHGAETDTSIILSNLIESRSVSWWGFQKGNSAMIIVETPDDAAYTFLGGPTAIGPTWRHQLGWFGYVRSLRMALFQQGNYVTPAKRYRRYATESGQFVSLKDKIARSACSAPHREPHGWGSAFLRNRNPASPTTTTRTPRTTIV